MSFFAYFAVLLVAAASALFGLDLLTSPLPPAEKPKAQVASTTSPPPAKVAKQEAAREAANKEANDANLTPVYPRQADNNVRMVYPPTNEIPIVGRAAPETTGSGGSDETKQAAQPQPAAQQAQAQQSQPAPAQPVQQAAQPSQTPQAPPPQPQVEQAMQQSNQVQPVAQASGPHCNVSACAAAYRSFNAADCTYRSFSGERRVCDKGDAGAARTADRTPASRPQPAETRRERVARQPHGNDNDDGRLEAAVRRVKQLTARAQADDEDDRSFTSAPISGRRVIVIERGNEGFWR